MDKIFIKDLRTYGILGIHLHEQHKPQEILINVEVSTDIREAAEEDAITKTVNYSTLAKQIIEFIKAHHFLTIEALIEALAQEILAVERVNAVKLRIEKPSAVAEARSVGVEISRAKRG